MTVALHNVAPSIDALVFIVTSYRGQTFEEVDNAYCRLVDLTTGAELARYTLRGGMPYTGVTMAVIKREAGDWKLTALGDGFQGKTRKTLCRTSRNTCSIFRRLSHQGIALVTQPATCQPRAS